MRVRGSYERERGRKEGQKKKGTREGLLRNKREGERKERGINTARERMRNG